MEHRKAVAGDAGQEEDMTKDKRLVKIWIADGWMAFEGPVEGLGERIREYIGDRVCNDPVVKVEGRYNEVYIEGWRPATEAEMERSRKAAERAKAAALAKKEKQVAKEIKEYERLKKKYEVKA